MRRGERFLPSVIGGIAPVWSANHFTPTERARPPYHRACEEDHTHAHARVPRFTCHLCGDEESHENRNMTRVSTSEMKYLDTHTHTHTLKWLTCHLEPSGLPDYQHGRNYTFSLCPSLFPPADLRAVVPPKPRSDEVDPHLPHV